MTKLAFGSIALLMLTLACTPEVIPLRSQEGLFGVYMKGELGSRFRKLSIEEDDTFLYEAGVAYCVDGYWESVQVWGRYTLVKDRLVLAPDSLTFANGSAVDPTHTTTTAYYVSDSTYLRTEYQFFAWDNVRVLLSEQPSRQGPAGPSVSLDYEVFVDDLKNNCRFSALSGYLYRHTEKKRFTRVGDPDFSGFPEPYQSQLREAVE